MAVESVDLELGEAATLVVVPPAPWSAPTAVVKDRKGTTIGTPTATPSTVNTTVASATDPSNMVVASGTAVARGLTIQVTDVQWGQADSIVAAVNGTAVRLVTPLPGTPTAGATVRGLDVSVALDDTYTAALGLSFVLRVREGTVARQRVYNVCTYPFVGPCNELIVREHMTRHFPGERSVHSAEWCERVSAEVNRLIRGRLLESDVYVSEYFDAGALEEVMILMRDLVLFRRGYRYPGTSPDEFYRSTNIELESRIGALLKGSTPRDADRDGVIDDEETEGFEMSVLTR